MEPDTDPLDVADRAELVARLETELKDGRMVAKLGRWANRLARKMRDCGIPVRAKVDGREPGEWLAHEAVVSTVVGERTWNGTYPLEAHLRMAIRSIASTEMAERVRQPPIVPVESELLLDDTHPGDEVRAFEMARAAMQRRERPRRAIALVETVDRWMQMVRVHLKDDRQAMRVAQAWVDGHTIREDAIAVSGLSEPMYEAAKKRIKRVIRSLPELRTDATDALEISHGG